MTCCTRSLTRTEPVPRRLVDDLPVAVIGGGPVGLAAAVHLLARGLKPIVFDRASEVGAAPRDWGHVRMFSPWRYNVDRQARSLLDEHGWTAPDPETFPTGAELADRYLAPLAQLPQIASQLKLGTEVTGIARVGAGKVRDAGRHDQPFEVRFIGPDGIEDRLLARAVVVATGTWSNPNPAGASGLPALGERAAADRIRYGMPDVLGAKRGRFAKRRVLVLGSGHSAIGTLIDLAVLATEAPGTEITWATRTSDLTRAYGGGDADQLPERGHLGQRLRVHVEQGTVRLVPSFAVDTIGRASDRTLLVRDEKGRQLEADQIIVATGLRPNLAILREVRLDLDPALECPRVLAPLIDPNVHSCGTVRPHGAEELAQPEEGLFLAGMMSYGRAPTFLLATGYEQVRSIAAFLAGDVEAARRVELDLPQTGVCSASRNVIESASLCCAPMPQTTDDQSCCGTARVPVLAGLEPVE